MEFLQQYFTVLINLLIFLGILLAYIFGVSIVGDEKTKMPWRITAAVGLFLLSTYVITLATYL